MGRKIKGYLLIFSLSGLLFGLWQWQPSFPCPDTFYHAEMAELIKTQGLVMDFPWLQQTILRDNFVDHHLLFHLLLIPFLYITNSLWAIKIAGILFAALFITIFYWLLTKQGIKYAWLYSLLLLFVVPVVARLNIAKTSAYSLIILWLGLFCLIQRKPWALAGISFIYVWLYDGWPLILLVTIIYCLTQLKTGKKNTWLLIACIGGLAAGIILNPYFPGNLEFYQHHIINIGLINDKTQFSIGQEWYPYKLTDLIMENNLAMILLVLGIAALVVNYLKHKHSGQRRIYFFLVLTVIFGALTLRSRRFIEYFIPLALTFSAYSLNLFFQSYPHWRLSLIKYYKQYHKTSIIIGSYLIITLAYTICHNTYLTYQQSDPSQAISFTRYQPAMEWAKTNIPAQAVIFNSNWDDWPLLFYHNPNNYYIVGLDPTFMHDYDAGLFKEYDQLVKGEIKTDLAKLITQDFHSQYVFVNRKPNRQLFLARLLRAANCKQIYADSEAYIFKLEL